MSDAAHRALTTGQRRLDEAAAAREAGDSASALRHARGAVVALRRGLGAADPNLAPAWLAVGHICGDLGQERPAAAAYERAAALLDGLLRDDEVLTLWLEALTHLAHARIHQGRYGPADRAIRRALPRARRKRGGDSVEVARLLNARGKLCKYIARFPQGLAAYSKALAIFEADDPEGPDHIGVLHNLGGLYHAWGRPESAEPFARRAVELRRRLDGAAGLPYATELAAWAPILDDLGRSEEAAAALREALGTFREAGAAYDIAVALHNLAPHEADPEACLREAIALKAAALGAEHWDTALSEARLAGWLADRRPAAARALAERAAAALEATLGGRHPHSRAVQRLLRALR